MKPFLLFCLAATSVSLQAQNAYVPAIGEGAIKAISLVSHSVVQTISVNATAVAVTPDGTRAYAVETGSNDVVVIDTASNSVTATIPVGTSPSAVAISPDGTTVYVFNPGDIGLFRNASLSVIATSVNTVTTVGNFGYWQPQPSRSRPMAAGCTPPSPTAPAVTAL